MLRKGFLHRDVSTGNTLMLDPPVTTKPFPAWTPQELLEHLSIRYENDLDKYVRLLENVIKEMGFSDKCHGLIIDGDMAAKLDGYFTSRDTGEVSVSICRVTWGNPTDDFPAGDLRVHVQKVAGDYADQETISALAR